MRTTLLEATDLRFSWGERPVLDGVDLAVSSGEVVALLGRNGAGKTTLLRMLNGLLSPDGGTVLVGGDSLETMGLIERAKRTAYVPQSITSAFPMRVIDVVLLGRRPHVTWRLSDRDVDIASNTLSLLGLSEFAFRQFTQLSGGERQQVILAKALAQEARLLLLDEPTSDLDLNNQIGVMKRIRRVVDDDENRGAVIVMHDLNVAASFADRVVLLHEGKVEAVGSPREVLTEENLAKVFMVDCTVDVAPTDGRLRIHVHDEVESFPPNDGHEGD
ncbi:MAG TPA: ABC transporter ATP-binding protein [Candidatus Poseidoniaceae archaeon]|nr:MAG TPA: ABC transporter ATP-binding protein [Candidatus Poseidoniales archaeon]HIH53232.1 ABC transporter ATP-binding protein [Candidatus Poseidoniaceae archaeon]